MCHEGNAPVVATLRCVLLEQHRHGGVHLLLWHLSRLQYGGDGIVKSPEEVLVSIEEYFDELRRKLARPCRIFIDNSPYRFLYLEPGRHIVKRHTLGQLLDLHGHSRLWGWRIGVLEFWTILAHRSQMSAGS